MTSATPTAIPASVCLIVCYIGKLPPYVDCVLRSCAGNPDIRWLLFTDDAGDYRLPPNVRRELTTLDALRDRFSRALGFPVALPCAYKICDFKPAFGLMFREYLTGCDFWGHCDLDQIFGDLRRFLRPEILAAHDRVFTRGHLSLYRNTPRVNELFRLQAPGIPGYQEVFADPRVRQFDEWLGIHPILRYHGIAQYHEEIAVDVVRPTRWRYPRFEGYEIENFPEQVFYWYHGKLYQAYRLDEGAILDREYAYLHFQKRRLAGPPFDPWQTEGFLITPDGFRPYAREPLTAADFKRYNASHWRPAAELWAKAVARLGRAVRQ